MITLLLGCAGPLGPGGWGVFRYFAEVEGEPPMGILAPYSDRAGNVYVVEGNRDEAYNTLYVGHARGGWSGGCSAHEGSFGVHGFVGRSETRAWLWSGDALVELDGGTGGCRSVLNTDPISGTDVAFKAVLPAVRSTPSRTTLVAWVQGVTDPLPYVAVVDLDQRSWWSIDRFPLEDAEDLVVLGTGAEADGTRGWVLLAYTAGGARQVEAWTFDEDGLALNRIPVDLDLAELGEHAVVGSLVPSDGGFVAGLLTDGRVVAFDAQAGGTLSVDGFEPYGVQADGGALWVTGMADELPVIAPLRAGSGLGEAQAWDAAIDAAATLSRGVEVRDERITPHGKQVWSEARSAIGPWPLVSPWPLDPYAIGETGWVVAGPAYETGLGPVTAVAWAPVGVSFP